VVFDAVGVIFPLGRALSARFACGGHLRDRRMPTITAGVPAQEHRSKASSATPVPSERSWTKPRISSPNRLETVESRSRGDRDRHGSEAG
jgi:hypothetical protein